MEINGIQETSYVQKEPRTYEEYAKKLLDEEDGEDNSKPKKYTAEEHFKKMHEGTEFGNLFRFGFR